MRASRLLTVLALATMLISAAHAQDIIEGDIPAGPPFDGSSGRASMFDLYQVARIATAAGSEHLDADDDELADAIGTALTTKGYPGTRLVMSDGDRACVADDQVEVRLGRRAKSGTVEVVAANQYWYSLGEAPADGSLRTEDFAQDCLP